MDFNSLKDQVSNLTLYDLKAGVRKVQNAVMNYTEMEAKVREATNNEPWGASTTLMQEIASGTYSYHLLNEIMPMIYKRFTDKAAEEWRQIYKGLQLLEFLIKNGSERVVDDARQHITLLKMLRQFQFIDQNGKDQGVNVRNRSKELAELLSDVDRIRAERKKARGNRNKFGGVEGGGGPGGGMSSGGGSRYGGFGSEDASFGGGGSGRVYGDGGGFGGQQSSFQDSGRKDRFEEYDEYDEGAATSPRRNRAAEGSSSAARYTPKKETKKPEEPPKAPEEDLFDFGDDEVPPAIPPKPATNGKQPAVFNNGLAAPPTAAADDDDFDDFISAPVQAAQPAQPQPSLNIASLSSTTTFASPQPVHGAQSANLSGLAGFASPPPLNQTPVMTPVNAFSSPPPLAPQQQQSRPAPNYTPENPSLTQQRPTGYQPSTPNYFTSVPLAPTPSASSANSTSNASQPGMSSASSFSNPGLNKVSSFGSNAAASKGGSSGGDAFGSLWNSASQKSGLKKDDGKAQAGAGKNLASMAREKSTAGIWGQASGGSYGGQQGGMGGGGGGLL